LGRLIILVSLLLLGGVSVPHIKYVRPGGWFLELARDSERLVGGFVNLPNGSGDSSLISFGRVMIWFT
jgi:hypothetical protein